MHHYLSSLCAVLLFAVILAPVPSGTLELTQVDARRDTCDDIQQGGPDWLQNDEWIQTNNSKNQLLVHSKSADNSSFKAVLQNCKKMMTLPDKNYAVHYVHVGKTGGSTIQQWMKANGISYWPIHVQPVTQCNEHEPKNWLISVRDPITRIVSAFNWRHPTYGGAYTMFTHDHGNNPREKELYDCFPHVNAFALAIGTDTRCGKIATNFLRDHQEHVGKGLAYYVGESLNCLLKQNVFLIHLENISKDMLAASKWLNITNPTWEVNVIYNNNKFAMHNAIFLSEMAEKRLKGYVEEDYHVLHELEKAFG